LAYPLVPKIAVEIGPASTRPTASAIVAAPIVNQNDVLTTV
jgi:hypothetical protein